MFDESFLSGILGEMIDVEQMYQTEFIDSISKKEDVKDGDYSSYHRMCKVFWLTNLKPDHVPKMSFYQTFQRWIDLLRISLNEILPPGFEVSSIEE
jgi:hypothetical protein